jgi:hypothetical protein
MQEQKSAQHTVVHGLFFKFCFCGVF